MGEIPQYIGSTLSKLKILDVSGNKNLCGFLPVMPTDVDVKAGGTSVVMITVRTFRLSKDYCYLDYVTVATFIALTYADIITDVLSIHALFLIGSVGLAWLNISFIILELLVGLYASENLLGAILRLLMLDVLMEGIKTINQGFQTQAFIALKKLDAICRSMPSMILQLYTLLNEFYQISTGATSLLIVSVAIGIVGSACTLSSLSPKMTMNIFGLSSIVVHLYYVSELLLRVITLGIMFVAANIYATVLASIEFFIRLWYSKTSKGYDFSLAMLWMGSDNAHESVDFWQKGSLLCALELFIFLLVINFSDHKEVLNEMRDRNITAIITWMGVVALFSKTVLFYLIQCLPTPAPEQFTRHMSKLDISVNSPLQQGKSNVSGQDGGDEESRGRNGERADGKIFE